MSRLAVALGGGLMVLAWMLTHLEVLTSGQDTLIRFVLSFLFAVAVLTRGGDRPERAPVSIRVIVATAVAGLVMALSGVIARVHQAEWIGLLLLSLACLWWVLPGDRARDAACAIFLVYWAHPLPSQVFAPLQLAMQNASVQGTEWFLHLFDTPVWGDGLVLRKGAFVYAVPEWCSGMRSATTVFLLGLGIGLFRRMRWYGLVVLLAIALLQALGLNILRLGVMVLLAPMMDDKAAMGFLHDTAGLIVLASCVLLVLELWLWGRLRKRWHRRTIEPDLNAAVRQRALPPFWASFHRYRWGLAVLPLLLLLAWSVAYKSRPAHRLAMRQAAVDGLQRGDQLEPAYRLAELIRQGRPRDDAWTLTVLRIQLQRGEYEKVMGRLEAITSTEAGIAAEKRMLRAYCLLGLGRIAEASALVRDLPGNPSHPDARSAMILAELGCQSGDPDRVAEYVVMASRWGPNLARIRKLYPYLRRHRKWEAIAQSDWTLPYKDLAQGLCATEAAMNLNRIPQVAALVSELVKGWPEDPRLLEPLFYLAAKRPDSEWEGQFAATLPRCLQRMANADEIYGLFEKCFDLCRPDLGWMVYRRLAVVDAGHPGLSLGVARFGDKWFTFRTRSLGQAAASVTDQTDLALVFGAGRSLPPWRHLWALIPRAADLAVADATSARKQALDRALESLRDRAASNRLSVAMQYEYAGALEMAGDLAGATQQLARVAAANPDEAVHTTLAVTEMHERRGEWETLYEILRPWADQPDVPLAMRLRLCRAEMQLNLGLEALESSRQVAEQHPYSLEAMRMRATALKQFDSPEEALFFLDRPRVRRDPELDVLEAELLLLTQRYSELIRFVDAASLPGIAPGRLPEQPLALPPAEQAVFWHRVSVPSASEFAGIAAAMRHNLKTASSPFLKALMTRWLATYEGRGGAGSVSIESWRACGRDAREQATALNHLTLLLCRQGDAVAARRAAEAAVEAWPASATLWRVAVGLSGADLGVITKARQACPADSELWLAEIVARSRLAASGSTTNQAFGEWVGAELHRVARTRAFSAGAVTRAGEYLLRGGLAKPATVAARDAAGRNRGLLPASMLSVRCALRGKDKAWALAAVQQAMREDASPVPGLYRLVAEIRGSGSEAPLDDDMVGTLKQLQRNEPGNVLWAEMLAYVLFYRGNTTEMMDCLGQTRMAIEGGSRKRVVFLLGAEAARQQRMTDQAAQILRKGLALYPTDLALLNNLAYTLSQDPARLDEACAMIPQLSRLGGDDPEVADTLATVCLRAGKSQDAELWIKRLAASHRDDPRWRSRIRLHQAGLALARGDPREACRLARAVLSDSVKVSYEDVLVANQILRDAGGVETKPASRPSAR